MGAGFQDCRGWPGHQPSLVPESPMSTLDAAALSLLSQVPHPSALPRPAAPPPGVGPEPQGDWHGIALQMAPA